MPKTVTNLEFEEASKNPNYINIIKKVTRKYKKQLDQDDRDSCGLVALWQCMKAHDDSYGQKFTTSLGRVS